MSDGWEEHGNVVMHRSELCCVAQAGLVNPFAAMVRLQGPGEKDDGGADFVQELYYRGDGTTPIGPIRLTLEDAQHAALEMAREAYGKALVDG